MDNEEKREKLDRLYEQLSKYKGKKDRNSVTWSMKIRREIRDTKNIMTHEEFERMLSERSEIDIRKC